MKKNHDGSPINLILSLESELKVKISELSFSSYFYKPQTITDIRKVYLSAPERFLADFENVQSKLLQGEEIAIHSNVKVGDDDFHIPMIDLVATKDSADLSAVTTCLKEFGCKKAVVYDSGRSLHIYGLGLIQKNYWIKFNGQLLLLNMPNQMAIVDTRWIGHRLIGGYGALRLTHNSEHYHQAPKFMTEISI